MNILDLSTASNGVVTSREAFIVADAAPSGSSSAGATQNIWNTRRLNTVLQELDGASLDPATSIITLPPNKYEVIGSSCVYAATLTRHRVYNVSDLVTIINQPSHAYSSTTAFIHGHFELTEGTDLAVQFWMTGSTSSIARQGRAISEAGIDEMFALLAFKVVG